MNQIVVSILVGSLLLACGSPGDGDDESGSALAQSWVNNCSADASSFVTFAITYSDEGSFDSTQVTYTGSDCSTKLLTFGLGGIWSDQGASTVVNGANNVVQQTSELSLTLHTDDAVATYGRTCGKTFEKDVAQVITSADCQSDASFGSAFAEVYDIYQIDGNSLYFGVSTDENDGSSAAKRPAALDTEDPYTKA